MRTKADDDGLPGGQRKLLLDLGKVPVARCAVGFGVLVALGEKEVDFRLAPGPADPAHAVDDDLRRVQQPGLQQRRERREHAGGIAPRRGHEPGGGDRRAASRQFRQAVDRLGEQRGSRVLVSVELAVNPGVAQAEIRAQIDHPQPGLQQRQRELAGQTVRQREKGGLRPGADDRRSLRRHEGRQRRTLAVARAPQPWEHVVQRTPGVLARGQANDLHARVFEQPFDEFLPGVTARPDHRDFLRSVHENRRPRLSAHRKGKTRFFFWPTPAQVVDNPSSGGKLP